MPGKLHRLYVYGTLMPEDGEKVDIPGYLYDLGWFPGARIMAPDCGSFFKAKMIEVDDARLRRLDDYEAYHEDAPQHSLYIRRPYLDGWIYEYNRSLDGRKLIEDGDWESHNQKEVMA